MKYSPLFITAFTVSAIGLSPAAQAKEAIHIVGSSTVYPFTSYAAEQFGASGEFSAPIVESTGTGGGMKIFCSGVGADTPDMTDASRPMKEAEKAECAKNGVKETTEITLGFDGIVVANDREAKQLALTTKNLFLALAKEVPVGGKLVPNPYKTWKEVDASLPDTAIEVYGPPPTSGTRDAFVEIVMEKGCAAFPEFAAAYKDEEARKQKCHLLREDGAFIEAGENDNIIVQKLKANHSAFGIFGYSFLEENAGTVQGATIDGVAPDFEHIADGTYPVARSLYIYVKNAHIGKKPGMVEFLEELTSEDAIGEDGYLPAIGLIPLPEDKQEEVRGIVEKLGE